MPYGLVFLRCCNMLKTWNQRLTDGLPKTRDAVKGGDKLLFSDTKYMLTPKVGCFHHTSGVSKPQISSLQPNPFFHPFIYFLQVCKFDWSQVFSPNTVILHLDSARFFSPQDPNELRRCFDEFMSLRHQLGRRAGSAAASPALPSSKLPAAFAVPPGPVEMQQPEVEQPYNWIGKLIQVVSKQLRRSLEKQEIWKNLKLLGLGFFECPNVPRKRRKTFRQPTIGDHLQHREGSGRRGPRLSIHLQLPALWQWAVCGGRLSVQETGGTQCGQICPGTRVSRLPGRTGWAAWNCFRFWEVFTWSLEVGVCLCVGFQSGVLWIFKWSRMIPKYGCLKLDFLLGNAHLTKAQAQASAQEMIRWPFRG